MGAVHRCLSSSQTTLKRSLRGSSLALPRKRRGLWVAQYQITHIKTTYPLEAAQLLPSGFVHDFSLVGTKDHVTSGVAYFANAPEWSVSLAYLKG